MGHPWHHPDRCCLLLSSSSGGVGPWVCLTVSFRARLCNNKNSGKRPGFLTFEPFIYTRTVPQSFCNRDPEWSVFRTFSFSPLCKQESQKVLVHFSFWRALSCNRGPNLSDWFWTLSRRWWQLFWVSWVSYKESWGGGGNKNKDCTQKKDFQSWGGVNKDIIERIVQISVYVTSSATKSSQTLVCWSRTAPDMSESTALWWKPVIRLINSKGDSSFSSGIDKNTT